ncbi:MAG: hypothetical protein ABSB19_10480 [Methylomonas sp.]
MELTCKGHLIFWSMLGGFISFPAAADNFTYTTISYPNAATTTVTQISDNGTVIGKYTDSSGSQHSFIESSGQYSAIVVPNAVGGAIASGISPNGIVFG